MSVPVSPTPEPRDRIAETLRASGMLGCGCCADRVPCADCDAEEYVEHDCQTWDRYGYMADLLLAAVQSWPDRDLAGLIGKNVLLVPDMTASLTIPEMDEEWAERDAQGRDTREALRYTEGQPEVVRQGAIESDSTTSPSPTPDEQAAEGCPIEGCGDNDPLALRWAVAAHEPGGPEAFFCSHACQSTAALVVVREQLTQASALLVTSASALHVALAYAEDTLHASEADRRLELDGCFEALEMLREATNPPPSPPTYTTEAPS